jgi:hypothetical protein
MIAVTDTDTNFFLLATALEPILCSIPNFLKGVFLWRQSAKLSLSRSRSCPQCDAWAG